MWRGYRVSQSRFVSKLIAVGMISALPFGAQASPGPINVGVIASLGTIPGKAIADGAKLAVSQINAHGGVNGRRLHLLIEGDNQSTANAIRGFQRLVRQDHAVAVVGAFEGEIALALEPWAARLHEPFLVTGSSLDKITRYISHNYRQRKYIFSFNLNNSQQARNVCDAAKAVFVKKLHFKTAVVLSENAAWTKPIDQDYDKCLPKAGLKVLKNIRFAPNTNDFTPIFQSVERLHPDVIITAWGHTGVKPTVQWAEQKVPIPLAGISVQAGSSVFWSATNGAANGVVTINPSAPGVAVTSRTVPFYKAYEKKFHFTPAYSAYTTYDAVHALAGAIKKAGSTSAKSVVSKLGQTDMIGTLGRVVFHGPKSEFPHGVKYGPGYQRWVDIQWQDGKQKCLWPPKAANASPSFPQFLKVATTK